MYITDLTPDEIKAIIRSNMFCADKFFPSGLPDRMKARFVGGGHMQDKSLYTDISSSTVSTSVVFLVAALAAKEKRYVVTVDIKGAYLHAKMKHKVIVYMRIAKTIVDMLVKLDKSYLKYVCPDGSMVVRLDKALYGCVESASLWQDDITDTLVTDGHVTNKRDVCCFNKMHDDKVQVTTVLHVDDLMITSRSKKHINQLLSLLKLKYTHIVVNTGVKLGYLGLLLDFSEIGSVRITAPGFINDLLLNCRETGVAVSPATEHLFEARDPSVAELVSLADSTYFHSEVAKLLYIGKRIFPEILVAISYLTTRVNIVDTDDMIKLTRVHKYINHVKERGLRLCIGENITVRAYVDAAYGVHADGKSHTGCMVIVGDEGAIYFKSAKQKIVAKSSTEGELIAASDSCNVPLHIAEFLRYQGYTIPPVTLYQDNKSAIALFSRGFSTSDLTKHISIRYFWIKERTDAGEVVIEYCPTAKMFANVLTKPLGGRQFLLERDAVTGWR
jgi:hypothetical protein